MSKMSVLLTIAVLVSACSGGFKKNQEVYSWPNSGVELRKEPDPMSLLIVKLGEGEPVVYTGLLSTNTNDFLLMGTNVKSVYAKVVTLKGQEGWAALSAFQSAKAYGIATNINPQETDLANAVNFNNLKMVRYYLYRQTGTTDSISRMILKWAGFYGKIDAVRIVLDQFAGAAAADEGINSALKNGYLTEAKAMMDAYLAYHKIRTVSELPDRGRSFFVSAVQSQKVETVKYLIEKGLSSQTRVEGDEENGSLTLLDLAMDGSSVDIVKYLIGLGIQTGATGDQNGLMKAVQGWDDEVVKLLLDKGLGGDQQAAKDKAFKIALENDKKEMVRYLLESGADVNATFYDTYTGEDGEEGRNSFSALDLAAEKCSAEVIRLLIENGATTAGTEGRAYNPVYRALERSDAEIVRLIAEKVGVPHGATVTAVRSGDLDIIKAIVENGGNVDEEVNNCSSEDDNGGEGCYTSPLDEAGDTEDIRSYLIDKGATRTFRRTHSEEYEGTDHYRPIGVPAA